MNGTELESFGGISHWSAYHQERCDTSFLCDVAFLSIQNISLYSCRGDASVTHWNTNWPYFENAAHPCLHFWDTCPPVKREWLISNYNAYIQHVQRSTSKGQTQKWEKDYILETTILVPFPVTQGFFTVHDQHVWSTSVQLFNNKGHQVKRQKKKAGRQNYDVNRSCCTVCYISALLLLEWFVIQKTTFLSKKKNKCSVQKHYVHF